jgi:hypothetical protein
MRSLKVVCEAPTLRSRRLIVTEHGIPFQARASWGRSRRSSRRSHDLPGSRGKLCTGRRATGEPLEPDAATRNAERPKGEKRQLASRMLGKLARPVPKEGGWKRAARAAPRQPPILLRTSIREIENLGFHHPVLAT